MMRALAIAAVACALAGCRADATEAPRALTWETDEAAAFERARAEGKGVMLDIRSDWCSACDELDAKTFSDPQVVAFVDRHYVALKLDVTAATEADEALQARYDAPTLPAVRFLSADGKTRARLDEFVPPAAFMATARPTVAD